VGLAVRDSGDRGIAVMHEPLGGAAAVSYIAWIFWAATQLARVAESADENAFASSEVLVM
jgi:hypothetical protein